MQEWGSMGKEVQDMNKEPPANWGTQCLAPPGTPLSPTTTPKKRHGECTSLPGQHQGCAWILPGQLSSSVGDTPKKQPTPPSMRH